MSWKLLWVFCAISSQTTRLEGSDSQKTLLQLFQKYKDTWKERNCTFPDPSTYTTSTAFSKLRNIKLSYDDPSPTGQTDSEIPLTPCQDPNVILSSPNKTIQQNSTVNICVAFFEVSLQFCATSGLDEALKKDNLNRLTEEFRSSSVCSILVSKFNFPLLNFLTTSEETCQNQCEKNSILAPLCRLLTAALKASDPGNDADKHSRLETKSTAMSTERATATSDVTQPSKPPPKSAVKSTGTIPPKRNVTEVKTKNESLSPEPDVDNSKISSTQSNVTALKTSSIENKGSPETSSEKITMSTEQSETESSPESTAGEVGKGAKTMDSLSQNTTLEKKISKDDKKQVTSGAPTASENSAAKNAQSNKKEPSEMTEGATTMDSLSQKTIIEPKISKDDKKQVTSGAPTASENSAAKNAQSNKKEPSEMTEGATTMDSLSQNTTLEKKISKDDKKQVTSGAPTVSENSAAKNAQSNKKEPSEMTEGATTMDSLSQKTILEKKISKDDKNQVTSGAPTASENSAAKNAQSNKKEPSEMTKDASDKNFDQDEIKENMADKDGSTVEVLLWICSILVVGMVVLLLYKKRQTIQNYAMKCKIVSRSLWQESGSKAKYAKLTSVEDAIPTVKKSVQAKNHIY